MSYFPTARRPRINLDTPLASPIRVPVTPPPSYHTMSPASVAPTPTIRAPLFSRPAQPISSALIQSQAAAPAATINHPMRVGRSGTVTYPPGHSILPNLGTLLRQADIGPYPLMPNVSSQAKAGARVEPPSDQATEVETVVERRRGRTMNINLGGLNRLPTISSHASQEGMEEAESTMVSTRVSSQRSRRDARITETIEARDANPTVRLATESLGAEVARSSIHSRAMQEVDRNASTERPNSFHASARMHRSKSSRRPQVEDRPPTPPPKDGPRVVAKVETRLVVSRAEPQSAANEEHGAATIVEPRATIVEPLVVPREQPRPASRNESRAATNGAPRRSKVDKVKERKTKTDDDHAARWILYDEQGNIKRIWKLQFTSDKIKAHEKPKRPSREKKARKEVSTRDGVVVPKTQEVAMPRSRVAQVEVPKSRNRVERAQVETSSSRAQEAMAVINGGAMLREQEAREIVLDAPLSRARVSRSVVSAATQISRVTTSDDIAYSHGIFEAQERIVSLEAEQDSIREQLRDQVKRMYLLPSDQMQAALQERVELKGMLTFIRDEIEGLKEVIVALRRNLRDE